MVLLTKNTIISLRSSQEFLQLCCHFICMLTTASEHRPQLLELYVLCEAHLLSIILLHHLLKLFHTFFSLSDLIRLSWRSLPHSCLSKIVFMTIMVLLMMRAEGIGLSSDTCCCYKHSSREPIDSHY